MRRALVLAFLVAFAVPGTATATVVSGSLTGAKLPKKGKGVAAVRAVTVETGTVAAAKRTRTGAFSLQLDPARYLVIASLTPFRGRKASADGPATRVKVTTKAKRKLKVRAKRRKKKHKAHRAARPGFVDVDYPAIWIKHFDTSAVSVEYRVMGKGMADMLITDVAALGPPACPTAPVVVEREHLDDVIAEIQRSNSPASPVQRAVSEVRPDIAERQRQPGRRALHHARHLALEPGSAVLERRHERLELGDDVAGELHRSA